MNLYTKQFIQIPLPESRSPFVMILRFAEVWVGPFSYRYLEFWWNVSNGQAFSPGISSDFRRLSGNASETLILIPLKKSPPETQLSKTSSSGGHSVSIACGISWFLGNKLILNSMLIKRTTEMILCIKKTSSYTNRPSLRIVGSHRKS